LIIEMIKISEVRSKSILTKSGFPEDDYCINPYSGCAFGCSYCFADFMRRFTGHEKDNWGEYVDVKVNAAAVLEKELERLEKRFKDGSLNPKHGRFNARALNQLKGGVNQLSIIIGSVTDPYQGVEAKYKITRKCLEVIAKSKVPAHFTILTKSHLVTRDIDVIKRIKNVSVGLTITTTDDDVVRLLEGNAPPASLRLKALGKMQKAGIKTYVCINPLLPHFAANEKKLRALFDAIAKTGNTEIWLEHINLGGNRLKRVVEILGQKAPRFIKYFEKARTKEYKSSLNRLIFQILKDYNFKIGGGGIFDHRRKVLIVQRKSASKCLKKGWKEEVVECAL
jgi:DNA repair photolyase